MKILIIIIVLLVIVYLIIQNRKNKPNTINSKQGNTNSSAVIAYKDESNEEIAKSDNLDNYWIPVETIQREVKLKLFIKYINSRSIISEREFDIEAFSRGPKGYHLHGYCYKKQRNITLSSLGVLEVKDISTGEKINDIIKYIECKYKRTIQYIQDLLFDDFGWAIYVLLYLSATSGSVVKKERDVIINFIKSLKGFEELSAEWIDETIKNLYSPGKMEIRNWIKEGIKKNYNFELLIPWFDKLGSLQLESNKEFQNLKNYVLRKIEEIKSSNDVADDSTLS